MKQAMPPVAGAPAPDRQKIPLIVEIPSWTNAAVLRVRPVPMVGNAEAGDKHTICLAQHADSLSFTFHVLPDQGRALAAALIAAADWLDAQQVSA